mgnify:FL=1
MVRVKNYSGVKIMILLLALGMMLSGLAGSAAAQEEEAEKSTIHIKAGELNNKDGLILLSGGLTIVKDDITLKSPEGEFDDEENKIILTNGVDMDYADGKITSQKVTGYLDRDDFIFENNVKMDYNPQEENEEGEKKKFTLESTKLDINSETQSFTAENNVIIDYDQKIIKGNKADYDGENEILVVTEEVYIQEENGDWIKSDRAEFDLSTGEENFKATGNVEIEITLD